MSKFQTISKTLLPKTGTVIERFILPEGRIGKRIFPGAGNRLSKLGITEIVSRPEWKSLNVGTKIDILGNKIFYNGNQTKGCLGLPVEKFGELVRKAQTAHRIDLTC